MMTQNGQIKQVVAATDNNDAVIKSQLDTGLSGKQNVLSGLTSQYVRGDGSLATFPTIPAAQVNSDWSAVSGVEQILNKPTIPAAQVNSDWNAVSGLAQILNKPSIPAAQIQSDWTQTNVSSVDYIKNKPTKTVNYPSRSLNSAFQISSTQVANVVYVVELSASLSLSGGQTGEAFLEYADDSGFTTNVKTVCPGKNANTGTLTIGLSLTQAITVTLSGFIPAGKYVRLRTSGTATATFRSAQEVLE